jgi:hypothetical protein
MRGLLGRAACAVVLLTEFIAGAGAADLTVPYVPTPQNVVDRMLEIAAVGPQDYLIDLGSGDGRIVVTAAKKYRVRGFGVDLNPVRINESNENAVRAGVSDRVAFQQRNLFDTDLSDATVITMYLLPRVNLELRPRLLDLKPGTRIVAHDFDMEDWKPDQTVNVDTIDKYGAGSGSGVSSIYFWIVPAKAAGMWQWQLTVAGKAQNYELSLDQKFQMLSGAVRIGGGRITLMDAKLSGDRINFSFTADVNGSPLRHDFSGRITGNSMEGTVALSGSRTQGQLEWSAVRVTKSAGKPGELRLAAH